MTQQLPRAIIPINTDPAFQPKGHYHSTALPAHIKILRYIDVPILGRWDWQLLLRFFVQINLVANVGNVSNLHALDLDAARRKIEERKGF